MPRGFSFAADVVKTGVRLMLLVFFFWGSRGDLSQVDWRIRLHQRIAGWIDSRGAKRGQHE